MERIITFTADDLGLNEETNLAIEHAHRHGALNAASLMMGQQGTAHALEIVRRNPDLQIGCHFHACDSTPLTRPRWPWGNSPARAGLALALWPSARRLVRAELQAQWDQISAAGVNCRFVNGHHHLHIHPFIAREMRRGIASSFTGWVRGFNVRFFDDRRRPHFQFLRHRAAHWLNDWPANRRTDTLWGLDRLFRMNADEVRRALADLPEGRHEFLFHPRRENDADQTALVELMQST